MKQPELRSRLIDRLPIHYSWVVLVAGTIGIGMTIPGQTTGVAVFLDFIIDDLGLGRSTVSAVYTAGTLIAAMSLSFVGRAIDRFGPRRSVLFIGSGLALACVFMGLVGNIVSLLVGFVLIRSLGQGALGLVSQHTISLWFVRRRGMAQGMAGLGFALAVATVPPLINALIDAFGWRTAYALLGVGVAAIVLPVGGGLFRSAPERYGQEPDGRPVGSPPVAATERNLTLGQARRTLTFWLFVSGNFLTSMLGTGLVFHHFSIMEANGLDRGAAASVFVTMGIAQAASHLSTGWLLDRLPPRFLLAVAQLAMALAMLAATRVGPGAMLLVYGGMVGTYQGMSGAIGSTVFPYYFGRTHLGAIRGVVSTITVAGSALGPLLLAVALDLSGSYRPVLTWFAAGPLIVAVVALIVRLLSEDGVR